MELYEKRCGEWYRQSIDIFGKRSWHSCSYVPSAARRAAQAYTYCRVEYDFGDATVVPMPSENPFDAWAAADAFERAARHAREEAARLEALERARRAARRNPVSARHAAAVLGGVALGELLAELIRRK